MIPRIVVPTNACIGEVAQMPGGLRTTHLVPRRLIPANAKLSAIPEPPNRSADKPREMMVRKLLVPEGARIGTAVTSCAPDAQRAIPRQLFEESFVNEGVLQHKHGAREWLISYGIHAMILGVVILLPLFLTQAIDPYKLDLTYLAAPASPPPPPPASAVAPRPAPKRSAPVTSKLTMPTAISVPRIIPKLAENEGAETPPDVASLPGGVTGGVPGGQIGGVLDGIVGGTAAGPSAPPPVETSPIPSGPLHVSGDVKPPRKLYAPAPQYPLLAQQARIEGVVKIDAIIDKDGNVGKERAVSGPPLLIAAALEAVKQWKYQPTYLNGVAWPIELTIDVTFALPKAK